MLSLTPQGQTAFDTYRKQLSQIVQQEYQRMQQGLK